MGDGVGVRGNEQGQVDAGAGDEAAVLRLARLGEGPEIFYTLQGEGVWSGVPAVFVRASFCNLHCVWCDTDYTWNWQGTSFRHEKDADPSYRKFRREEEVVELQVEDVARRVMAYDCRHLVLTGGEPLLQSAGWEAMLRALPDGGRDWFIEVETNGTRLPGKGLHERVDQYNVSPKLANSGQEENLRIVPEVLRFFAGCQRAWFKFVIAAERDLEEVRELVAEYGLASGRVMLMPEGRTAEVLERNRELVVEACLRHGYRFSDRLHLRLFGARRGT